MGSYVSARREVLSHLRKESRRVVDLTANRVLQQSRELVPQPARTRQHADRAGAVEGFGSRQTAATESLEGFASARSTGALKASGYVATQSNAETQQAYLVAVEKADSLNPRIEERGQLQSPLKLEKKANEVRAAVHYPLTYAALMHDGFHHVRGGYRVAGVPFLLDAAGDEWPQFLQEMKHVLESVQGISPTTQEMRDAAAEARYNARLSREARGEVRESKRAENERLRSKRDVRRERGETMLEAQDRIRAMKEEIRDTGEIY